MKLWRNHISLVTGEWNYELTVGIKNEDSVVFSAVVSRSCGPASSPGWVIVLCFGTRYSTLTAPLSTQESLRTVLWNLTKWCDGLVSNQGMKRKTVSRFRSLLRVERVLWLLSRPFLRSYELFPFLGLVHFWEFFSVFQSLYLPWNKDLWERQCTMPLNWEWTMEITPSFLLYWILSWFKDMQQNQVFCLMACMRQRRRSLSPSKRKRSFTTRTNRCYSWFLTLWRLRSMRILQLKWNIRYLSHHSVVMFTRDINWLEELSSIQILTDRYKYSGNADFTITIIKRRGELVSHNVNKWAVEQFQLFKVQC